MDTAEQTANPLDGAIVLAGGKSSRMGRDKAMLPIENRTLLERAVSVVRPLARETIVVADTADKYALPGCRVLGDAYPDTGPVGGILTGLSALGEGWSIVVACDMPFLHPDLIRLLHGLAEDRYDAVLPVVNDRPEPLCAVYRHTAIPKLREFLDLGGRAAHRALEILNARRVDEGFLRRYDPLLASFINVNTPRDYHRAKREEPDHHAG